MGVKSDNYGTITHGSACVIYRTANTLFLPLNLSGKTERACFGPVGYMHVNILNLPA